MLEDWQLLLDDEVAVGCQLKTGRADDGFTDPLDAIVVVLVAAWTSAGWTAYPHNTARSTRYKVKDCPELLRLTHH